MRYPSKYVLVTDLDDENFEKKCSTVPPVPISEKSINDLGHSATMHNPIPSTTTIPERVWQECIANPVIMCPITTSAASLSPSNGSTLTIKEEPNNDMSGTTTSSSSSSSSSSTSSMSAATTTTATSSPTKATWEYTDPTQKMSCSCTK